MLNSNLIKENEEHIKEAISEGIGADAVNSTLEDVVNRSDELGKTPEQVKEIVETIVDMKDTNENKIDESYASDFVKENNQKIKSALNNGISPDEVSKTLVNSTDKSNTKKDRKHLKFIVKLISKMKRRELNLNNEKGKERILK